MAKELKYNVGDIVWCYNQDHARSPGRVVKYTPQVITGITSRSYIVGEGWCRHKVPHADALTEAQAEEAMYFDKHQYRIQQSAKRLKTPGQLRALISLTGWREGDYD